LAKLDRIAEAQLHVYEVQELKPDFPVRGKEIMKRLIVLDENVDMLWDRLIEASLDLDTGGIY
jgi:hypothetical protein